MDMPVEIHFHGISKSDAIEDRVREKVAKLARHFERMSRCRVVLEAPHRNPQKAKVYLVKIEIGIPSQQPVVITHEREGANATEELGLAIRDAFEAAKRRVDEISSRITERSRNERSRRKPRPDGDVTTG
ncbi:MAG: HPF/RaiA family ribosome-associated protein [Hyphomicrobiaceae bacterium]|jgi:ribosome-associated translation inhibitor RaiA